MKLLATLAVVLMFGAPAATSQGLWKMAREKRFVHRFSALFTAQNVRDYLSSESSLAEAIAWCKSTGVTKVYLEAYRADYTADRKTLLHAKRSFRRAGIAVSGCVTTTQIGKPSTGWKLVSCYTNKETQQQLRRIFEYAASIFDEIMIDDFWFTDCSCDECDNARRTRRVVIGDAIFPVRSDSWEDYRGELMLQLSRLYVRDAARKVNPRVRLIVKYPQWYERYQERGYDVVRETRVFDKIWAGTETRDLDKGHGEMQYEAYFLMRWLSGVGGTKMGGGWYDPLWTTKKTYVEQARQTVLGGAGESVLFCYGALRENFGPADIEALRLAMPELWSIAQEVKRRRITGIAAFKPPGSHADSEAYVFDDLGMIGLPLVPCHRFPTDAPVAFFPVHSLKKPDFVVKLAQFIETGKPVLLTSGLARRLTGKLRLDAENIHVLRLSGNPKSLLSKSRQQLDELRAKVLEPLKVRFRAPGNVALYLFHDGSWVVENFQDRDVTVEVNGNQLIVGARQWTYDWK